jgi:hypothetical protein
MFKSKILVTLARASRSNPENNRYCNVMQCSGKMRWIVRIPDATARHVEGHFFVDLYLQRGLF